MRKGEVKIGTLHGFRRLEGVDVARGDSMEGLHYSTFDNTGNIATFSEKTYPSILNEMMHFDFSKGGALTIQGGKFRSHQWVRNCFIFSVSELRATFLAKAFDTDRCLELLDPEVFAKTVCDHLDARLAEGIEQFGLWRVDYGPLERLHNTEKRWPASYKDDKFSYQKEWRFIWIPRAQIDIQPVVLRDRLFPSIFCPRSL